MYDTILAKTQSIIFQPGGTSNGLTVTTWAEVQSFIAFRTGTVVIYVDDSIQSPALVPGGSGITDCEGRVEFRPFIVGALAFTALQVEPGATLRDVFRITAMEVRGNAQSITPSLDFVSSPNGANLILEQFGALTNASTATNPIISVGAGDTLQITGGQANIFHNAPTVPLISVAASGILEILIFNASFIDDNVVSGAGDLLFSYDNSTANSFPIVGTPPTNVALTGTYSPTNTDNIWAQKPIDPTTFNAPVDADLAIFDGPGQIWRAVAMSGDATITNAGVVTVTGATVTLGGDVQGPSGANTIVKGVGSIIYKPGTASTGDQVATWAEVKTLVTSWDGKCIVYVDDSITSPATVPTATGITDCGGRVELRAAKNDSTTTSVLEIENGATLRDLSIIRGVEVRCNTQSATPALDFTSPDGGNLLIKDFGALSNASTATAAAIVVAAGLTLFLDMEEGSLILNAPAVPLFSIAATGLLEMWVLDATDLSGANPNFAAGAGDVQLNYDNSSATFFGTVGFPDPPPLAPGLSGTYTTTNVDNVWQSKPIDNVTFDTPAGGNLPVFSSTASKWRSLAMSGDATMDENGVVTVTGGGGTLTGNVNGPLGANRFLSLVHNVTDSDFAVTETEGWTWIGMIGLTADRTVTLPAAPVSGEVVAVTDVLGSLGTHNIIISGNGKNVQGAATYTMSGAQNGGQAAVVLQYDGTHWEITAAYSPNLAQILFTGPLTSAFRMNAQDVIAYVDTTAGAVNLTLPTPIANLPMRITFRDRAGTFQTNNLTLTPPGAVNINGANVAFVVSGQYPHIVAETDGVNYFI